MKTVAAFFLFLSGLAAFSQEISGIGIALAKDGDDFVVKAIIPDSPASASKAIHAGDRIIAIAQGDAELVHMTGLGLVEAVRMIRGPKGTAVRVTVVPSGKEDSEAQVIKLVRGELKGVSDRDGTIGRLPLTLLLVHLGLALAPAR